MGQEEKKQGFLVLLEGKMIRVTRVFNVIGQVAILVMMFLTVTSSLGRYFFKHPIPGSVEITCLLMVVMTFMLGPYVLAIKRHINISVIPDMMPDRLRYSTYAFRYLLIAVISFFGFTHSIKQGIFIGSTGTYTSVLHIPYSPFYYIVSIGWLLFFLVAVTHLFLSLLRAVKK
jgi:TRAP-type C4-dicarboxylate transport system permease small subunit